jgi:hypothetical protein
MKPDEEEPKSKAKNESNKKEKLHLSKRNMTSHRLIGKNRGKDYLNDELRDKIDNISQEMMKPELVFMIPFNVKRYMIYSLVVNVKTLKNKYYSNKFIQEIFMKIKFKQVKISNIHSNFYPEFVEYLNKFFRWNTEYKMFSEHFKIIRDLFDFVSFDLKKMFYDFILKKPKFIFNKKSLYLIIFLLNEIHQFKWCFTQIIDQLLTYSAHKSKILIPSHDPN